VSGYLAEIRARYGTDIWCDSPDPPELSRAVRLGACGMTCNPFIVNRTVRGSAERWRAEIPSCRAEGGQPNWNVTKRVIREALAILEPVYRETNGQKGVGCIQVNPHLWNDTQAMVAMAREGQAVAPNAAVKIPVTKAGVAAIEELAAENVSTNGTVVFTLPQLVAIGEAFKRGKARAVAAGKLTPERPLHSFATLMVGRLDDHLRDVVKETGMDVEPEVMTWAGIAVAKKAYQVFKERGYESRILIAAMRGHYHIEQFIGGDVIVTVPPANERAFGEYVGQKCPAPHFDDPVPQAMLDELLERFVDFRRAYFEDGMQPEEFASYGASVKTLNQFIGGWDDLVKFVESAG